MKYAQLVMGSAGTGKSTYCNAIQQHCATTGRSVRVANLDPAAESFKYSVAFDIRDLISVDDVMSELQFGPNGGLIYCMEYLVENMDWLKDHLESFLEDDYLLIDCPGQIELYSHVPVMRIVANALRDAGFNVCGVYCVDSLFITDASKLIAGNLMALAAMVHLELPHVNVLTKCDLVEKSVLDRYLSPSGDDLVSELTHHIGDKYQRLNKSIARLLDDYDMVSFLPLDVSDEDSITLLLMQIDNALQYGEDMEPKEPADDFDDVAEKQQRMAAGLDTSDSGSAYDGYGDGYGHGGGDDGAYGAYSARGGGVDDRSAADNLFNS